MIWAILAFGFVALGSKVLLALAVVYGLLPEPGSCAACDGETTPLEPVRGLRSIFSWVRIQHRWCPRCGETFLARGPRPRRLFVGSTTRRPDDALPAPDSAPTR